MTRYGAELRKYSPRRSRRHHPVTEVRLNCAVISHQKFVDVSPMLRGWRIGPGERAGQFGAPADAELPERVGEVLLDRARGHVELVRDFGVGEPLDDESGDLEVG